MLIDTSQSFCGPYLVSFTVSTSLLCDVQLNTLSSTKEPEILNTLLKKAAINIFPVQQINYPKVATIISFELPVFAFTVSFLSQH